MQLWRRWNTALALALALTAALSGAAMAQTAPPAPGAAAAATSTLAPATPLPKTVGEISAFVKAEAKRMASAATATDALEVRRHIMTAIVPTAGSGPNHEFRSKFAQEVASNFLELTASDKPAIALNAIILIADQTTNVSMNLRATLGTDNAMVKALGAKHPAVRYWAAKGLGQVIRPLEQIQAAHRRAISGMTTQLAKEPSPLVQAEIMRSLAIAGAKPGADAVRDYLATKSKAAANGSYVPSDVEAIGTAFAALESLAGHLTLNPAEKTALVQDVANLIGFSEQYYKSIMTEGLAPRALTGGEVDMLHDLMVNGVQLVSKVGGVKVDPEPKPTMGGPGSDPMLVSAQVVDNLVRVAGSQAAGEGKLQKAYPGVKVPPKMGAAKAGNN